jgi:uncharacterized damage-inducible protein DinB
MNEIARLAKQLELTFSGDAWHGPTLENALEGISAAQAAALPAGQTHGIWEFLLHLSAWEGAALDRLTSGYVEMPTEGDWPDIGEVSEANWAEAQKKVVQRHRNLVEYVAALSPDRLDERLGDARVRETGGGVTVAETVFGVIQHNVYHIGQIVILKKHFQN